MGRHLNPGSFEEYTGYSILEKGYNWFVYHNVVNKKVVALKEKPNLQMLC